MDRLKKAVENSEELVQMGRVRYIDYETEAMPPEGLWSPFLHKRKAFAHECEFRCLVLRGYEPEELPAEALSGTLLSIDVTKLVETIYISPNSPAWFAEVVNSVIKQYGFGFDVVRSSLLNTPYF